ncbi:MAG: molybdopterin-dependent oxidoreductase [Rhodospirillales bacterium]|nr:molybdopterin-dependent oxidoreductase [Rhodospirillales bacterium]
MNSPIVGKAVPQVTALEKIQGRAIYTGDLKQPGMLHAKVLRGPYPHARIVRIDTSQAVALPGVKAVVTGADTPTRLWGVAHKQQRILATGKVRFAGEEVAAVAAISEDIARDALDLIEIEYEELPALLDPARALEAEAPQVHDGHDNRVKEIRIARGDVEAGFAAADLVHEATYELHSQYPGYMEPMATLASVDGNGRLTVWTSTQSVFLARARLAEALDRPVSSIRVIQAMVGGGFGGKIVEERSSLIAAFLATRVNRPVRLVNNRLEDFQSGCFSVPCRLWLKMGMTKDGTITAKDVRILANSGAYAGLAPEVMLVTAMRSDNMHRLENVRSAADLVYTNTMPRGAFRGFGGTQMAFALNSHLSVMADKLGLDPFEVHRRNAIRAGETSVHGWQFGSTGLRECLDQVQAGIGWEAKRRRPKDTGVRQRGLGMAAAMHVSGNRTLGNWDGSTVVLRVNEDGRAFIASGESDMGQGANTMMAQICADELGIPLSHVTVLPPDTDTSPFALGSLASRVTINGGKAVLQAAQQAKTQILDAASGLLGCPADDLEIDQGVVRSRTKSNATAALPQVCRYHVFRHGGEGILVRATYDPPTKMMDADHYGNIAPGYSFAAQAVEVEVDTETGQVTLLNSCLADDCGKAINPMAVHGQTNGAAVQAIGWALYEHLQFEDGRLANGNFADYTMPTADSVPHLQASIVESNEPNGPLGAKGASETAILPGAPAIANAIEDAIGVRITELPITPEKILAGLRAKREGGHA